MAVLLTLALIASLVSAPAREATLIVTVVDPSGAVVPDATVTVRTGDGGDTLRAAAASTSGVAVVNGLAPGVYTIQADFSGFDPGVLHEVKIRAGERLRLSIALKLRNVEDSVTVSRDTQAAAADPRGDAFATTLTREEIDALPDDPAERVQRLLEMAGGAAVIRVDGFNGGSAGGAMPPKSAIKSIRIERNRFAAEHHSPDFDEIAIVTQPGIGPLRGGGSWRVRDSALNGRNPFAAAIPPERTNAWQANVGGTLVPSRASFSLSAGLTSSFDTPLLNIAIPGGGTRAELLNLRRPTDTWTTYDLFDYAITPQQLLRMGYVQNDRTRKNLGVGAYDLPERAYSADQQDRELRLQESGPIGKRLFATTRFGMQWSDTASHAAVEAPTIRVIDAFTSGGAQVSGGRHTREIEFATDVDYARGPHAIRAGLLIEGGRYRSDESSNYLGTYTFPSLDAFAAAQPASFTRRVGDPHIAYWNMTAGVYVEDDFRIGRSLTLSPGVRYEAQTHVRAPSNVSPRVGVTWAPFTSGRTTIQATYGFFSDWLNPNTYEQTLRVDGVREQELTLSNPSYPLLDGDGGGSGNGNGNTTRLPSTRYLFARDRTLSTTHRFDVGINQTISPHLRAGLSYYIDHDDHVLRGRNLNAPIDGVRPDPAFGNIIEAVPDARFRGRQLQATLTVNLTPPGKQPAPPLIDWRRENVRVAYTLSRQENDTDGPFSVPPGGTLATEWASAPFNRRHRVQASLTSQAIRNVTAMVNLAANTGTPYTITTGLDDNGDAIFNDRPAGIGRNSLRMPGQFTLSTSLSYSIGVGTDARAKRDRCRLTWTVNAMNLSNHANYAGLSGVLTSPFFMRATTVQNPRKVDLGVNVAF